MVAAYLTAALEDSDPNVFLVAVGQVAKARGMSAVAESTGLGSRLQRPDTSTKQPTGESVARSRGIPTANQLAFGGVLPVGTMHGLVRPVPPLVVVDVRELDEEFAVRVRDSATLAFRVAFSVLRNHHDAEDVAQEAFARAHRAFSQLKDREAFRAWLVRMTWRLALDHRRGAKRRVAREQVPLEPSRSPTGEDYVIASDRARRLWEAIDQLPDVLRETIVLASMRELSIREVAQLTAAPEGTVKSRIFDAKKLLKEMLS